MIEDFVGAFMLPLSDGNITHVFLSPKTLVSSFSDQLAEITGDSSGTGNFEDFHKGQRFFVPRS